MSDSLPLARQVLNALLFYFLLLRFSLFFLRLFLYNFVLVINEFAQSFCLRRLFRSNRMITGAKLGCTLVHVMNGFLNL